MSTPKPAKLASVPSPSDDVKKEASGQGEERLTTARGEVVSLLEEKIEELRRESEKMHTTMEQILYRIRQQGFSLKLDDLKTGRWYKIAAQVAALQEVLGIFGIDE